MKKIIIPGKRKGIIHIPSSKSDSQRAILAAALAKGESTLINVGKSLDEFGILQSIQTLGAKVEQIEDTKYLIKGIQNFPQNAEIDIIESGLGCRLITNVCATQSGTYKIIGKGSILTRPMLFFENTLPQIGVKVTSNNGFLPIEIQGPVTGGNIEISGKDSSQYLSGLLMGLPISQSDTYITVNELNSLPYVEMTLNTLLKFGINIQHQNFENFIVGGKQRYISCTYTIESDWSSASYWLVASALGLDIELTGLTLASYQADKQILKAFEAANCTIEFIDKKLKIKGKHRKPFRFDATNCPDLFPALVTFAALCDGKSEIIGVNRLAHKESNRGIALQQEFEKLGVTIVLDENTMHIYGKDYIEGGNVNSHNDHRIAMCLAIAGLLAESKVEIEGAESVGKSYPEFWNHLENLEKE